MAKFIYIYHGGSMPESDAEVERIMGLWGAWLQGLGDAIVDAGNPVGASWTVSPDGPSEGGGPDPLSGYSIVRADSMDDAIAKTAGCPHITEDAGRIEVAEIIELPDM